MAIDLSGRVCLITGAARGIGRALAAGFASRGAVVIPTDRTAPAIDGCESGEVWDVRDAARAASLVEGIVSRYGKLNAFVANAAWQPRQAYADVTPNDWREVIGVNLDGAWFGCQAAAKAMEAAGYGKIVAVTSIEVQMGVADHVHYDASKAGLIGMMRALARASGQGGVRVNCLMPGGILTEGELEQFPDQELVARHIDSVQCIPGRILPEMLEPVAAFLCSAESDVITGQVICADQGWVHY